MKLKSLAWLRKAIEDDYSAPDGFISHEDRERQEDEEKRRNETILEAQEQERKRHRGRRKSRRRNLPAKRNASVPNMGLRRKISPFGRPLERVVVYHNRGSPRTSRNSRDIEGN